MRTTSTIIENSSCWSCWSANEIGSDARGKCSARTSPRLPEIARTPTSTELCVKVNTNTPVTRNGTYASLGMPLRAPSSRPKMKKYTAALSSGVATCQSWPSFALLYCAVSLACEKATMKWRRPHSWRTYAPRDGRAPLTVRPWRAARAARSASGGSGRADAAGGVWSA